MYAPSAPGQMHVQPPQFIAVPAPPTMMVPAPPMQLQPQVDAFGARMQRLQQIAMRYEIRPDWVVKLRQLESFKLVMVLDDSGSMNTHAKPLPGKSK